MEFLKHKLANGLEVVAERNDEAYTTALGFFVQTGARDETDNVAGVSHFLEHMVFKGTPTRSADEVNREFDEMGADYNAFTSEEHTVYYAAVLPECQDRAVALLGDIMRPALREEDFNTEKQVIIEEIRMYEDQPPFGADDKVKAIHFGQHPLARSVLGTVDSIGALAVGDMRAYFESRYSPGNLVLAGAGKIDFDRLVASAEKACGHWKPQPAPREKPPGPRGSGLVECLYKESAALEYILQIAAAPSATDADRYAAKIAATILGDDSGSRLFWDLVDTGLAEQASLSHGDYDGAGLFMTYMSCRDRDVAENLSRIADIYAQATQQGFTADEIKQAKSKISSRVVLGSERPRRRLFSVGGNWQQRREYRSVKDDLASIDAVTPADLKSVLGRWPLAESTTIVVGPLKKLPK